MDVNGPLFDAVIAALDAGYRVDIHRPEKCRYVTVLCRKPGAPDIFLERTFGIGPMLHYAGGAEVYMAKQVAGVVADLKAFENRGANENPTSSSS